MSVQCPYVCQKVNQGTKFLAPSGFKMEMGLIQIQKGPSNSIKYVPLLSFTLAKLGPLEVQTCCN